LKTIQQKYNYLHIPLDAAMFILSGSSYDLNEFKTYLAFAFRTSGNCKLNSDIKQDIIKQLKISERTLNKHINTLINKKYLGYNKITNSLFINSLGKIRKHIFLQTNDKRILSKNSFILNYEDLYNLKYVIFGACETYLLRHQNIYKQKVRFKHYLDEQGLEETYNLLNTSGKLKLKHSFNLSDIKIKGDSIKMGNPNHFDKYQDKNELNYLGVSNTYIGSCFQKQKSWASKIKNKCVNLDILKTQKQYKYITNIDIGMNISKYLLINFPNNYQKMRVIRRDNKLNIYETLYDEINSNIKLSKRF
jgi:hypothetical protein